MSGSSRFVAKVLCRGFWRSRGNLMFPAGAVLLAIATPSVAGPALLMWGYGTLLGMDIAQECFDELDREFPRR